MLATTTFLGFLFGVRHSFEADHIAAVAALATRTSSLRDLLRLAVGWGAGHSLTILVVGSVAMALGATLPQGSEAVVDRLVGPLLVLMGLDVLRRALAGRMHLHVHEHDDGEQHLHLHLHDAPGERLHHVHRHDHSFSGAGRALAMGTLHGLGGSAALLLLVVPQAGSVPAAIAALLVFGAGSIAGMLLFSLALSLPLRAASRFAGATVRLQGALGAATVLVGLRVMAG